MNASLLVAVAFIATFFRVKSQPEITVLDSYPIATLVRHLREQFVRSLGPSSEDIYKLKLNLKLGKLQKQFPPYETFPCNETIMRSATVPESVHTLRPGDIDIVGALGDSLTAANGAMATQITEVFIENRGLSWSIGGQGTWRQFLTIPNILKEFNPKLYGYSIADGSAFQRLSRFNVAETGAMTQDLPFQAKNLVKRMLSDLKVDVKNHWKLITILIGDNDFCSNMCYLKNPEQILTNHEHNLISTLRILRDYLPRTMVNMFGNLRNFQAHMKTKLNKIMLTWNELQRNVTEREEFNNRSDFIVNYQPFGEEITIPRMKSGSSDFSYLSLDCFHFSQKGYATAANALWSNMLEPEGQKTNEPRYEFDMIRCPSQKRPYLMTRENSRMH
ncbi:phospholipase B1, membrane-associated-like [Ochlerotatus camptorhynchus]|uniref:phospholipase B1, membrane-associated-like n=1 Tax=Ochlerotatus camptorhynchus TaxID=644619 RepID=UPI0031D468A0